MPPQSFSSGLYRFKGDKALAPQIFDCAFQKNICGNECIKGHYNLSARLLISLSYVLHARVYAKQIAFYDLGAIRQIHNPISKNRG